MAQVETQNMQVDILQKREQASSNITYELKPTTKRLVMDRQTVQRSAVEVGDTGAGWVNGNTITFEVNTEHCIDPHTLYLRGDFSVTRADGTALAANTFPRLKGSISKCFESIKVSFNETEVESAQQFNLWSDIHDSTCLSGDYLLSQAQSEFLDDKKVDSDVTAAAAAVDNNPAVVVIANPAVAADLAAAAVSIGTTTGAAVNALIPKLIPAKYETKEASDWIRVGREFVYPLFKYVGVFQQPKYLPMKFLGKMKVEIKLVNSAYNALTFGADPTDARFNFRNLRLCYDTVRLNDELNVLLGEKIASDGLLIDFRTYAHTADSASISNKSVKLQLNTADALSVYATVRNAGTIGTYGGDDTFYLTGRTDDNKYNGVPLPLTWQLQVGTDYFPKNSISNFTQARAELDKAMAHFGNIQRGSVPYKEFSNGKYVIGVNLENDPVSSYTGRITKDNQIELNLENLSVAAGADAWSKQVNMFVLYTRVMKILPDRVVYVYK